MPYPYTAYHLGPSFFMALLAKRFFDLPVFVLSNFVIDVTALFIGLGGPEWLKQGHIHSLVIGAGVGVLWGIAAHVLFDGFLRSAMLKLRLPYATNFPKRVFSGILGTWLHILIDFLYKPDIRLFWPSDLTNPHFPLSRLAISIFTLSSSFLALAIYVMDYKRNNKRDLSRRA